LDLRQNKSKDKKKLEDVLESGMGGDFKESKHATRGSMTEQHANGRNLLKPLGFWDISSTL